MYNFYCNRFEIMDVLIKRNYVCVHEQLWKQLCFFTKIIGCSTSKD